MDLNCYTLPREAVASDSPVVVLAANLTIVSEHDSKKEAEKGLCAFELSNPGQSAAVFRRIGDGWVQSSSTNGEEIALAQTGASRV